MARVRVLTPREAWEALVPGDVPLIDDITDYESLDELTQTVLVHGECWTVQLARRSTPIRSVTG